MRCRHPFQSFPSHPWQPGGICFLPLYWSVQSLSVLVFDPIPISLLFMRQRGKLCAFFLPFWFPRLLFRLFRRFNWNLDEKLRKMRKSIGKMGRERGKREEWRVNSINSHLSPFSSLSFDTCRSSHFALGDWLPPSFLSSFPYSQSFPLLFSFLLPKRRL